MSKKNLYFEDEILNEKFNKHMLKRVISYASAFKMTYVKVIVLLVASSLLSLVPATLNKMIIDNVLPKNGSLQENYIKLAVILLSIWITLSLGFVIADYFCCKVSNILGNSVVCNIRKELFDKLMTLGFDYYDSRPTGKILVRITNYTDELSSFFVDDMTRLISNVFIMIFSLICVFVLEYRLGIIVLVVSIPLVLAVWTLSKSLHKRVQNDRNKNSNRTAFVAEDINGLEVIKAFNREDLNSDIHDELCEKYHKAFMRTTHIREMFFPMTHGVVRIICTVVLYSVALFIIQKNIGGNLSLGTLVTVSTYMSMFSDGVYTICQRLQNITDMSSNMERIFDVLDTNPLVVDKNDAVEMPKVKGKVEFSHVSFSYEKMNLRDDEPKEYKNVLTDINVTVNSGEMIALVGPTGAGKTTFVSLIDRFYDVDEGKILIDGIDIRDVTMKSLRSRIGVMMQDTFLFSGTVMDNIRFSKPEASDEECIEAAKKVYANDFIMKMKDGYNTIISSQGTELSGGEKQLLSFARLILANPDIVILDEATSNIDTETEELIQKMCHVVLKGRTSFVIAHRLSTIKNADRILYIDNEKILEDGSHDELMAKKGYYYNLKKHHEC